MCVKTTGYYVLRRLGTIMCIKKTGYYYVYKEDWVLVCVLRRLGAGVC